MANFSYEQRYTIEVLFNDFMSISEISMLLKIDKSVFYWGLNLNCDSRSGIYKSGLAQHKFEEHLFNKQKK